MLPSSNRPTHISGAARSYALGWRHFLWVGWLAVAAVVYFQAPRPYLRFNYDYSAASIDPRADRHYHRCRYVGWPGHFDVRPTDGQCAFVVWHRHLPN